MDMKDMGRKAKEAMPDDQTTEHVSDKVQDATPDGADRTVDNGEQWIKDHNEDHDPTAK